MYNKYIDTKTHDVILPPCVHEQEDGTIFANCATGTSTKDSLLSWVRCLQIKNPVLSEIAVVFTLKNYSEEIQDSLNSGNKELGDSETYKTEVEKVT